MNKLINDLFFEGSDDKTFIISVFESVNEVSMKNYLLKNHKRFSICGGKYWIVSKDSKNVLNDLWKFVNDKYFICLHL